MATWKLTVTADWGVGVRHCIPEEATDYACGGCGYRTTCEQVAFFSFNKHGYEGAQTLAEDFIKQANPNGALALGKAVISKIIGRCSDDTCRRAIIHGRGHFITKQGKLLCEYCGIGAEDAKHVAAA